MKNYKEMDYEEKMEINSLFATWLKKYTHEVIVRVIEKRDEIMANEFAMGMLKELATREKDEDREFNYSIEYMMGNIEDRKEYDPHSHPLTHSQSYRDVLYDMYIRR